MTSVEELQLWADGVSLYDSGCVQDALEKFQEASQNAKIVFNIACSYLSLGQVKQALQSYKEAIRLDAHLAVGFYMSGLANYHEKEYEAAMSDLEKAFDLLRGNRMVDYRQLGLKFKLYSCEILTNQAVIMFHRKKIGKAKGLLLQAVGCKAEKKHESIVDSLSDLQSGQAIYPFSPPQNAIFRPSKAVVDQLKKKDYLGQAKVLSTENEESVYACFSGLKDDVIFQQKSSQPVARIGPAARKEMLSDIHKFDRKATLKPVQKPPRGKLPDLPLGRVIDNPKPSTRPPPPTMSLPSKPPTSPLPSKPSTFPLFGTLPKPPRSKLPSPPGQSMTLLPRSKPLPNLTPPTKPLPLANSESDESSGSDYEDIDQETLNNPGVYDVSESQSENGVDSPTPKKRPMSESGELKKPARDPPKPPPKNSSAAVEVPPRRSFPRSNSQGSAVPMKNSPQGGPPPKPLPSSLPQKNLPQKDLPPGAPPKSLPAPPAEVVIPPRRLYPAKQQSVVEEQALVKPSQLNDNKPNKAANTENKEKEMDPKKPVYEVEVQYTFIQKIKVQDHFSLADVQYQVQAQAVPNDIELCFNDDLGRQQTMSERRVNVLYGPNGKKKIFCFPA